MHTLIYNILTTTEAWRLLVGHRMLMSSSHRYRSSIILGPHFYSTPIGHTLLSCRQVYFCNTHTHTHTSSCLAINFSVSRNCVNDMLALAVYLYLSPYPYLYIYLYIYSIHIWCSTRPLCWFYLCGRWLRCLKVSLIFSQIHFFCCVFSFSVKKKKLYRHYFNTCHKY